MTEENAGQGSEQGEGRSREGGGGEGKKMVKCRKGGRGVKKSPNHPLE